MASLKEILKAKARKRKFEAKTAPPAEEPKEAPPAEAKPPPVVEEPTQAAPVTPPVVEAPKPAPTVTPPKRPAFKIIMGDTKSGSAFSTAPPIKIDSSKGPRGGTQGSTIGGRTKAKKSKMTRIKARR